MVAVVAIILVLVTIVLPAANALWGQRRIAEAENTIQGLLMTARGKALRAGRTENTQFRYFDDEDGDDILESHQATGGETGLLFYVDKEGAQRISPIAQVNAGGGADELAWQNVFGITPNRDHVLPKPMRVVPRYAVVEDDRADPTDNYHTFSAVELDNNDFADPPSPDVAQRHRNFFTMIYSDHGHLLVGREVLIYDYDTDDDEDDLGDRTGLKVGQHEDDVFVTTYYDYHTGSPTQIDPLFLAGGGKEIPYLLTVPDRAYSEDVALNFPSVDGLLVYDDSLFNGITTAARKRDYLLESAQPFYVNRLTGAVIRGPRGENVEP
jgi:hypothetical protein